MEESSIQKFYKGQKIFLTGGTGFLGKVIVEKLLWTCNDLGAIYLLVRNKKGKTREERFEDYFSSPCFDRLRNGKNGYKSKVKLITGDCQEACLGLSNEDIALLKEEVTCIIHAAANVRFNQFIREVGDINVRSVIDLVDLAKQMPNLKAFVYVSTAFSNCVNNYICEKFYDSPMKARQLLSLLNALDDETLENITPHLKGKFPNTYVYTKCIAESHFREEGKGLPITIVRPAIVNNAMKEPEPGWGDSFFGIMGVLTAGSLGVMRNMYVDRNAPIWMVPVDQTTNIILAAGWKVASRGPCDKETSIYNFVGSPTQYYTWGEFMNLTDEAKWKFPVSMTVWYPTPVAVSNYYWYKFCTFFQQIVPAYLADFVLGCLGKPRIAVKNMMRIVEQMDLLGYFTTRHWNFQTKNVENIWSEMSETDKKLFDFDVNKIKNDEYVYDTMTHARRFLMKDPVENMPYCLKKLKVLMVLHYLFLVFYYYILYKLLVFIFNIFF